MYRIVLLLAVALSSLASAADKAGCTDHPLFPTRMPGYELVDCQTKEFDGYDFFLPKAQKNHQEGRFTFLTYRIQDRKNEQSGLAVVRNYEAAIKKIGGTVEAIEPNRRVNGKVTVDGKETWFEVDKGNGTIWIRFIEKQPMEQHVVADAASMGSGLKNTGHVAVEGIFFDTGKSEVKPESTPALEQVAKLLAADASLKLWVVGHTDAVGKIDDNMKLSQARAEAVVTVLTTKHGVAAARLKGYGVGPLAPVATNDTDEGRAKNRRVELVKQ
jgi:outer membrane protein OmpA-like peptidoglycan-associated protein